MWKERKETSHLDVTPMQPWPSMSTRWHCETRHSGTCSREQQKKSPKSGAETANGKIWRVRKITCDMGLRGLAPNVNPLPPDFGFPCSSSRKRTICCCISYKVNFLAHESGMYLLPSSVVHVIMNGEGDSLMIFFHFLFPEQLTVSGSLLVETEKRDSASMVNTPHVFRWLREWGLRVCGCILAVHSCLWLWGGRRSPACTLQLLQGCCSLTQGGR